MGRKATGSGFWSQGSGAAPASQRRLRRAGLSAIPRELAAVLLGGVPLCGLVTVGLTAALVSPAACVLHGNLTASEWLFSFVMNID